MASVAASAIAISVKIPPVITDGRFRGHVRFGTHLRPIDSGRMGLRTQFPFNRNRPITNSIRTQSASSICAASLNARCSVAVQTKPVTKKPKTITHAPIKETVNSPQLDSGGTGFPPRDDGGGGGGGGGGGWSGGFFLFAFLAFLGFLKDHESEGDYREYKRSRQG